MKNIGIGFIILALLQGCMPFAASDANRYQLVNIHRVQSVKPKGHLSILVMQPSALPGYDTEQMLYVNQPFQVRAFTDNVWMSPPATMILPLMVNSLSSSHFFYAVASDPNVSKADYRLESQLLRLQQNFLSKPSQIQLMMQVMLIHTADNRVVATETISEHLPCTTDNPLGGVIAANHAVAKMMSKITHFVIEKIEHDAP